MAEVDRLPRSRRVILDAGGVLALARGDGLARAALARAALVRAKREGYVVVIPTPVLAEVHRGGRRRAGVDHVVKRVNALLPTSPDTARRAGELMGAAGTDDAVDAIVVAEALASIPAVVLTSDADDIRRLLGSEPDAARVAIVRV